MSPPPFWLMRQAGRYLPEYRALRERAGSFLDMCFTPDLAVEVTLQPLRRFDMDAAILFSDILVVPHSLGQEVRFVEGEGPRLAPFGFSPAPRWEPESFDAALAAVYAAVARLRAELPPHKSLIGFAGAPWTVACYMVQGHGDGIFSAAKRFAFSDPGGFDQLIAILTTATTHYLSRQAENGADVVQLFDSWAGLLPEPYFTRWVTGPAAEIFSGLRARFPRLGLLGFPRQAGRLVPAYAAATGADGVGLDAQFPVTAAREILPPTVALQGDLDPALLCAGGVALDDAVRRLLDAASGRPFVFNLAHGVMKETPPAHVARLAEILRRGAA